MKILGFLVVALTFVHHREYERGEEYGVREGLSVLETWSILTLILESPSSPVGGSCWLFLLLVGLARFFCLNLPSDSSFDVHLGSNNINHFLIILFWLAKMLTSFLFSLNMVIVVSAAV